MRYALRRLLRSPGFAAVALLTLALGIGANTAIFSIVHAVLLAPLPYPEHERIGIVTESDANQPSISVAWPNYLDYRRELKSFEHLAASRRESYNLSGLQGRAAEQISGALVTANFFDVIGLKPKLGRVFTPAEDQVGGPTLVVLSDRLWARVFQRDPNILGRSLNLGNQLYTVIGIMPAEMFSPRTVDAWFSMARRTDNPNWQARGNHPGLIAWGRLKQGVTFETALGEMKGLSASLEKQFPDSNSKVSTTLTPLLENQIGEYRKSLVLLLGATGFVLLIACANLANLLAARGAARAKETAVRSALGAGRGRLIRELLTESLLLAGAGAVLGALFAWGARDLIVALAPVGVPRFQQIQLDGAVLGFSTLLAVGAAVLGGLWPAITASRANLQLALKAGAQAGADTPTARRARHGLIVTEVALTLVLLAAAGLVLKSFSKAQTVPLGFSYDGLLSAKLSLPSPAYEKFEKRLAFTDALLAKLRAIPGVERAALASQPPLLTGWQTSFQVEGTPDPLPGQSPSAEMCVISEDYFPTMQVPVLRGRSFDARDTKDGERTIIVDQAFADRHFPGQDALGKRVLMSEDETGRKPRTIVGIAPRLKVYGYEDPSATLPQAYVAQSQTGADDFVLLLRSSLPPRALEKELRAAAASIDPTLPIYDLRSMGERVAETWATPRLMSWLLSVFAGLALALSAVGLYGVMSHAAERRKREVGVRLALGATAAQIRSLMLGTAMRLLVLGLGVGLFVSLLASRVLQHLLYDVSALDPLAYAIGCVLLTGCALIASWVPALRAARVDPITILRAE